MAGLVAARGQRLLAQLATRHLVIETTASGHRAGVLGAAILGVNGALSPERLSRWIHSGTSA